MINELLILKNFEYIKLPLIISVPHSGAIYSKDFLDKSLLNLNELKRAEDIFVDDLLKFSFEEGICFIKSLIPRIYVDLNRHPLELDPNMFISTIPCFKQSQSFKVLSGIGVIPKVSVLGNNIYSKPLLRKEVVKRLLHFYFPYHKALRNQIKLSKSKFGKVLVLDCHSMPSESIPNRNLSLDINLGNNNGSSISNNLFKNFKANLESVGFITEDNAPYSGGFITQYYGKPQNDIHVVQLEINRSIYMDERNIKKLSNFKVVSAKLKQAIYSTLKNI